MQQRPSLPGSCWAQTSPSQWKAVRCRVAHLDQSYAELLQLRVETVQGLAVVARASTVHSRLYATQR